MPNDLLITGVDNWKGLSTLGRDILSINEQLARKPLPLFLELFVHELISIIKPENQCNY